MTGPHTYIIKDKDGYTYTCIYDDMLMSNEQNKGESDGAYRERITKMVDEKFESLPWKKGIIVHVKPFLSWEASDDVEIHNTGSESLK